MRITKEGLARCAALALLLAVSAPPAASGSATAEEKTGQSADREITNRTRRPDERSVLQFSVSRAPEGIGLTGTVGDFQYHKLVRRDGTTKLELRVGPETFHLDMSPTAVTMAADGASLTVDLTRQPDSERIAHINRMLDGSAAIRRFRDVVRSVGMVPATPVHLSVLVSATLLDALAGDLEAPRRLAARVTDQRRTGVRFVRRSSCFDSYEKDVGGAMDDLYGCLESVAWILRDGCAWRWTLQVESAWFSFLSCSAFPMKY
ncbi:MAG: hypothetical protein HYX76_10775 [Acidobacteria bacterium]|nr:hypothetical protein [Acidobacteriota bacterium]